MGRGGQFGNLSESPNGRLDQFDGVGGGLVYEVAVDPVGGNALWNLRTDRGEMLASGLYLYVLVTDRGASEVGRLVIAR